MCSCAGILASHVGFFFSRGRYFFYLRLPLPLYPSPPFTMLFISLVFIIGENMKNFNII
jgi:hypothetical protein